MEATVTMDMMYSEEAYDFMAAMFPPAADFVVWPYGKRWFLPKWTIRAAWLEKATERDGETTISLSASSTPEVEIDNRIRARFLRWVWIKVWIPMKRAWPS